jgi:hypothetical protein
MESTKAQLIEVLKETEEWKVFIEHVETIVIEEIKSHKGEAWWKVLIEIVMNAATKCSGEMLEAVKGSANIPAEWKVAGSGAWVEFAVEVLISQGKIISGVFAK